MTWLLSHSGLRVPLDRPAPADIRFDDIAESLSRLCRFTGHAFAFYSVAQHSRLVADLVARQRDLPQPQAEAYALLHDAHEAYLGDLNSQLKRLLAQRLPEFPVVWRGIVAPFDRAIFAAAGLAPEMPAAIAAAVQAADLALLAAEFADLFPHGEAQRAALAGLPPPATGQHVIRPETWTVAADKFRKRLQILQDRLGPSLPAAPVPARVTA